MRFLIMGCGSIGKRHLGNLTALNAGEVFVFDLQQGRVKEAQAQFGVEGSTVLQAAWDWKPDVVLVTAPSHLHVPLAIEAVGRGCHLFIEKPLSDRLEGARELLEAVRRKRLITLVGCNMRFHPGLQKVKALLDEGVVGRIVAARVEVGQYLPDWHPLEDYRKGYSARREMGGGVILDAIHEIDYIRWMLGEVVEVACFSSKVSHLEIETEDTAAVLLRFVSGAIGEVHLDYLQRTYSRSCHVIGEEGTIRWNFVTGQVRWYVAGKGEWQVFDNPVGWDSNQMYMDEMSHFLRCLAGKEEPSQDVFEAICVLEVALAAKMSAASGKTVRV